MTLRRVVLLASLFALLLSCVISSAAFATGTDPARRLADRVASTLVERDVSRALAQLHHPDDHAHGKRERELARIAASLRLLLDQFGTTRGVRFAPDPAAFFEVSSSAASPAYWSGLARDSTKRFVYFGRFSNFGPGFVIVDVVQTGDADAPELARIGLGLPMNAVTTARAADMQRALLEVDGWGNR